MVVKRIVDRILLIKLVVEDSVINVISAYASQVGLDDHTKKQFRDHMNEIVQEILIGEKVFIQGDFNSFHMRRFQWPCGE